MRTQFNSEDLAIQFDGQGHSEALKNADNYANFATLKYWSLMCNKAFSPAISEEDAAQRLSASYRIHPPQAAKRQKFDINGLIVFEGCWPNDALGYNICY